MFGGASEGYDCAGGITSDGGRKLVNPGVTDDYTIPIRDADAFAAGGVGRCRKLAAMSTNELWRLDPVSLTWTHLNGAVKIEMVNAPPNALKGALPLPREQHTAVAMHVGQVCTS
jgi:hypothetical protein